MKNFFYEGQVFKNGNIHIRFSKEEIEDVRNSDFELRGLWLVCRKLEAFDCEMISEAPECLGNFSWFVQFKRNLKTYHFTDGHLDMLLAGKTAILYPM